MSKEEPRKAKKRTIASHLNWLRSNHIDEKRAPLIETSSLFWSVLRTLLGAQMIQRDMKNWPMEQGQISIGNQLFHRLVFDTELKLQLSGSFERQKFCLSSWLILKFFWRILCPQTASGQLKVHDSTTPLQCRSSLSSEITTDWDKQLRPNGRSNFFRCTMLFSTNAKKTRTTRDTMLRSLQDGRRTR